MDFTDNPINVVNYIDAVQSPNFRGAYTNKGLQESLDVFSRSSRTTDPDVSKVIFLLTDGMPTVPPDADRWVYYPAMILHKSHLLIKFVINLSMDFL